jgi:hypothetical protein
MKNEGDDGRGYARELLRSLACKPSKLESRSLEERMDGLQPLIIAIGILLRQTNSRCCVQVSDSKASRSRRSLIIVTVSGEAPQQPVASRKSGIISPRIATSLRQI